MNVKQITSLRLMLSLGAISLSTGCIDLPPAVKNSVVRSREGVEQLHVTHAQDARGFASVVNEHEIYVRKTGDVVRRALRAKCEAQMELSKARIMAAYDRRAAQISGIEFQNRLKKEEAFLKFDELEQSNATKFLNAIAERTRRPTTPGVDEAIEAAQREVFNARIEREKVTCSFYLSIEASLRAARFQFETEVDRKYFNQFQPFLDALVKDPDGGAKLADFNRRIEKKLVELDESYNSLDQALSDLSTFLDGEAMSRRFASHFWKGAASALVDDLKEGKLGGEPLADLFDTQSSAFTKEVKKTESEMQGQAEDAADEAAADVEPPAPKKKKSAKKA